MGRSKRGRQFRTGNKYGAIKKTVDGILFDSTAEANFYVTLKEKKEKGSIKEIELQPKCYLTRAKILYKPDFKVTFPDGSQAYIDIKGFATPVFNLKKKLWKEYGPGVLKVVEYKRGAFKTIEEVENKGRFLNEKVV